MKKSKTSASQKRQERELRKQEGYRRIDWWVRRNALPAIVGLLCRHRLGKAVHGLEKIAKSYLSVLPKTSLGGKTQQINLDFSEPTDAGQ